jgi:hypothetical protein
MGDGRDPRFAELDALIADEERYRPKAFRPAEEPESEPEASGLRESAG